MKTLFLSILLFSQLSFAKLIKVAVIDTGFNRKYNIKLCNDGHMNMGNGSSRLVFNDENGHGTNVSSLIEDEAKSANYCQIIIKYSLGENSIAEFIEALRYIQSLDVDVINYSGGGPGFVNEEYINIVKLLKQKKFIVVAAGNTNINLDKKCDFFPACYSKKLIIVGNGSKEHPQLSSNYGSIVNLWIDGNYKVGGGQVLSGTSQSTAIATGKLIKHLDELYNKK